MELHLQTIINNAGASMRVMILTVLVLVAGLSWARRLPRDIATDRPLLHALAGIGLAALLVPIGAIVYYTGGTFYAIFQLSTR